MSRDSAAQVHSLKLSFQGQSDPESSEPNSSSPSHCGLTGNPAPHFAKVMLPLDIDSMLCSEWPLQMKSCQIFLQPPHRESKPRPVRPLLWDHEASTFGNLRSFFSSTTCAVCFRPSHRTNVRKRSLCNSCKNLTHFSTTTAPHSIAQSLSCTALSGKGLRHGWFQMTHRRQNRDKIAESHTQCHKKVRSQT